MNAHHDTPAPRRGDRPTFRLSNPTTRVSLGVVASAAILGATALLFGPVSDQRALALAGTPHGASYRYAGVVDKSGRLAATNLDHAVTPHVDERSGEAVLLAEDVQARAN